jgi:hypothetical protein
MDKNKKILHTSCQNNNQLVFGRLGILGVLKNNPNAFDILKELAASKVTFTLLGVLIFSFSLKGFNSISVFYLYHFFMPFNIFLKVYSDNIKN